MSFGRVGWLRFNDKPFMSSAERGEFRRLRDGGAVTSFGAAICSAEGCDNEVPRGVKLYCSEACWKKEEGQPHEKEEEASGSMD
jgi:hypothetical protein